MLQAVTAERLLASLTWVLLPVRTAFDNEVAVERRPYHSFSLFRRGLARLTGGGVMALFQEFKKFAVQGNVIDIAVGIIIGAAFGRIVSSLVEEDIMPPIGLLLGNVDFSNLFVSLTGASYESLAQAKAAGAPALNIGLFLNTVINFVIVAFAIFLLVHQINRWQRQPASASGPPTTKNCPYCCSTIPVKATRCPACTSEVNPHRPPSSARGKISWEEIPRGVFLLLRAVLLLLSSGDLLLAPAERPDRSLLKSTLSKSRRCGRRNKLPASAVHEYKPMTLRSRLAPLPTDFDQSLTQQLATLRRMEVEPRRQPRTSARAA
jgi:large conductance mechanosensitive channel